MTFVVYSMCSVFNGILVTIILFRCSIFCLKLESRSYWNSV